MAENESRNPKIPKLSRVRAGARVVFRGVKAYVRGRIESPVYSFTEEHGGVNEQ